MGAEGIECGSRKYNSKGIEGGMGNLSIADLGFRIIDLKELSAESR